MHCGGCITNIQSYYTEIGMVGGRFAIAGRRIAIPLF